MTKPIIVVKTIVCCQVDKRSFDYIISWSQLILKIFVRCTLNYNAASAHAHMTQTQTYKIYNVSE